MANIVHFSKADITARTTTSTTPVELTDYTITWANLTGAGFAAGDDVVIIVGVKTTNSDATANGTNFGVGFGTTFAGRTEIADSDYIMSPFAAGTFNQYNWIHRRTLVINQNIYFRGQTRAAATATYQEFRCFILKLGDLTTSYYVYSENNPNSATPTAYDASGAGATIPATGDWLILGVARIDVVTVTQPWSLAINDGTSDLSELTFESEDAADFYVNGTMAYRPGLSSGTTVRVRHKAGAGAAFTTTHTKLFGLRLDAFEDHAGVQTANTVTMTVLDQFEEFASPGAGSYSKTSTGPFVVMGCAIVPWSETTKRPYGRIQIGEADWPAANANRLAITDQSTVAVLPVFLYGYEASRASGTLNIDLDVAEDADISPSPTCTRQIAVAFSLALGALGVDFTGTPTAGTVSVNGKLAALSLGSTIATGAGSLAFAGATTALQAGVTAAPIAGALRFVGQVADVPQGLTERLTPNAVVAGGSNLRDTLTNSPPTRLADIDEPTGSDDAEWWTAVNPEANIDIRFGFPTSSGNLVGTQTLRALIRGTSLPSRDVTLELWESGSKLTSEITEEITSLSGQIVTLTFPASELSDITGAGVELRVRATAV
jgi:hypothetical protein